MSLLRNPVKNKTSRQKPKTKKKFTQADLFDAITQNLWLQSMVEGKGSIPLTEEYVNNVWAHGPFQDDNPFDKQPKYAIRMENPIPITRPLFDFKLRNEIPHPDYSDILADIAKESKHVPTGLLNRSISLNFTVPTHSLKIRSQHQETPKYAGRGFGFTFGGHNHEYKKETFSGTAKSITITGKKWRPNRLSAAKRERIRMKAAYEYSRGTSSYLLAQKYGVTRSTIHKWFMKYYYPSHFGPNQPK